MSVAPCTRPLITRPPRESTPLCWSGSGAPDSDGKHEAHLGQTTMAADPLVVQKVGETRSNLTIFISITFWLQKLSILPSPIPTFVRKFLHNYYTSTTPILLVRTPNTSPSRYTQVFKEQARLRHQRPSPEGSSHRGRSLRSR